MQKLLIACKINGLNQEIRNNNNSNHIKMPWIQDTLNDILIIMLIMRIMAGPGSASWCGGNWRGNHSCTLNLTQRNSGTHATQKIIIKDLLGALQITLLKYPYTVRFNIKGNAFWKITPYFYCIFDLNLFDSRICVSYAWKVTYFGEIS